MRMMTRSSSRLLAAALVLAALPGLQPAASAGPPTTVEETGRAAPGMLGFSAEAGVLVGVNNPNDYVLAPVYLSLDLHPPRSVRLFGGGWRLATPLSATLGVVTVANGPESLWLGVAFGPKLVLENPRSRFAFFVRLQGGCGVIDSAGVANAQGQDFTLTALYGFGVLYRVDGSLSLSLALANQHISKGNLSEPETPNTGLDSLGPVIGLNWRF